MALIALLLWGHARRHPEDVPWTRLDLSRPVGMFTGRKLAALNGQGAECRSLLRNAGIRFTALPARGDVGQCGYDDSVRFRSGGAVTIDWRPADLGTSCPVAAGLALWEWHVVQPASLRHFGAKVAAIDHYGSYSCRRLYGRSSGGWSEHATANAIDVAAFRLEDGRLISVARDWRGEGSRALFLREVRDGACKLFATALSPDYNAAHRDHLHLDQAKRGEFGWRGCR
ncbi:MAG: extensin-like domain-containing protein [Allosphingosinicella sp.]